MLLLKDVKSYKNYKKLLDLVQSGILQCFKRGGFVSSISINYCHDDIDKKHFQANYKMLLYYRKKQKQLKFLGLLISYALLSELSRSHIFDFFKHYIEMANIIIPHFGGNILN